MRDVTLGQKLGLVEQIKFSGYLLSADYDLPLHDKQWVDSKGKVHCSECDDESCSHCVEREENVTAEARKLFRTEQEAPGITAQRKQFVEQHGQGK